MYTINFKEDCKALKAKLQQKYTILTDEDLSCTEDRKEGIMKRLQQRLGKTRDELGEIILKLND